MKNIKGYGVRLFILRLPTPMNISDIDRNMIIEMGKDLCQNVNTTRSYYDSTIVVDPDKYFWADGALFRDVYGDEAAYQELIYHCPPKGGNYMERHEDTVRLFFPKGYFPPVHAQELGLPQEEWNMHPSVKKTPCTPTTVEVKKEPMHTKDDDKTVSTEASSDASKSMMEE